MILDINIQRRRKQQKKVDLLSTSNGVRELLKDTRKVSLTNYSLCLI